MESAIPIIVDKDTVDHIPKKNLCVKSLKIEDVSARDAAAHTNSCTEWCSSYLW